MDQSTKKATPEQARTHNSQLVLKTIYDHDRVSRADVARVTGLARPTVSEVVADLMESGLIEEVGHGPSTGGKPPILLRVVDDSRHLVGIDLSLASFRGAEIDLRGKIKRKITMPVGGREGDAALGLMYELIDDLIEGAGSPLLGIGVGAPGLVDVAQGIVHQAVNLGWHDLPLRDLLQRRYHLPVYVANDCQVAALAEYTFGGLANEDGVQDLVVIKVGWGIGAGIILKGQLFYGTPFGAGEIGHLKVVERGEPCRCGGSGCLETVASARAVVRRARAIARSDPSSALHGLVDTPEDVTLETVVRAFEAGDGAIQALVADVGSSLGIAVATLISVLGGARVQIAGSIARFGYPLLEMVREEVGRRSLSSLVGNTEVEVVDLDPDLVLLGASALLLPHELGLF